MKKKAILLSAGICALAMLAGCGKDNNVTLGEYNNLEVSVEKAEITDEDVRSYMEGMVAQFPDYEKTDKTVVEDKDTVNIDYVGYVRENYEGPGTDPEKGFSGGNTNGNGAYLKIGSNSYIDGFEEGLIGALVGEQRELNLTFPDPYKNNPELSGAEVVFVTTVNAIVEPKKMTYDALTDEYVAANFAMYGFDSVQSMKDNVAEFLKGQNEYNVENNKREAVLDKLMELCTVSSLPEGLLEERIADYKEKFEEMCQENAGMSTAEFLEQQLKMTEEEFNSKTEETMKKNIELELILLAIAEKEKTEFVEEDFKTFVSGMMKQYGFNTEEELYEEYDREFVKNSYMCNKVADQLTEKAKVTYTEPSKETEDKAGTE